MSSFSGGPDLGDIFGLDRDVERAYRAWQTWRLTLRADPEAHADEDVFLLSSHRRVATKSLFDGLAAQADPAGAHEGLRRWIAFLLQARNTHDADVSLAREAASRETPVQNLDEGRRVSYREAWRGVVGETARGKAIAWFDAAAARGPAMAAPRRERRARREEVLRRLGLEGESALVPKELSVQGALAEAILAATHDLADAFLRDERKQEGADAPHPVDAIRIALARGAREGWPARLSPRWLHELFGGWLTGAARFELGPLPAAISGASFVRALEIFGQSFRRTSFETRPTLPFALRSDPHFVDVHRTGALTASLAASPPFQRRALGLGKDGALLQARTLGKTLLFTLRLNAARVLLGAPTADGATWDDVTARLFGAPAARSLAGAWPECRDDEGARLVGSATVLPWLRTLVDEFDEDWFFNPRAFEALRARTLYPARAWTEGEAVDPSQTARDIGRHFEELFG
ncbi:hypothetical protein LVJ94_53205 [Pendulispora rubella]|uniref:Uncharacterized protein n=1 Tax=Pendulispora rubella TaxID=2741070 RepID=A0ABZ2L4H7_9BACT